MLSSAIGPHSSHADENGNELFRHLAIGWLDVSAIAVSKRWSDFLVPLLPDMLVASHRQQQRLEGWMGLNQVVLRSLVLRMELFRVLLADLMRKDEAGNFMRDGRSGWATGMLDRLLGRAIVELSFQPWLDWRLEQQQAIPDNRSRLYSGIGMPLCSLRCAGEVDVNHVLGLLGGITLDEAIDNHLWVFSLQDGFMPPFRDMHADHPSLTFQASTVFKRSGNAWVVHEPLESTVDFVSWLQLTHPAAAPAVLKHVMERNEEWLNESKNYTSGGRLKAADQATGRWLLPHEMLRLLQEHCEAYGGPRGSVLLEDELMERLNLTLQ